MNLCNNGITNRQTNKTLVGIAWEPINQSNTCILLFVYLTIYMMLQHNGYAFIFWQKEACLLLDYWIICFDLIYVFHHMFFTKWNLFCGHVFVHESTHVFLKSWNCSTLKWLMLFLSFTIMEMSIDHFLFPNILSSKTHGLLWRYDDLNWSTEGESKHAYHLFVN